MHLPRVTIQQRSVCVKQLLHPSSCHRQHIVFTTDCFTALMHETASWTEAPILAVRLGVNISFITPAAPEDFSPPPPRPPPHFTAVVIYICSDIVIYNYILKYCHSCYQKAHTLALCCRRSSTPTGFCVFWLTLFCIQQAVRPGSEVQCIFPVMWSVTVPQWTSRLIGLDGRGKQL